jgi:ABC-type transport system substrate-binding protein
VKTIIIASTLTTTILLASALVYFGYRHTQNTRPGAIVREIPPPEKNDSLVLRIPQSPVDLDPLRAGDPSSEPILPFIFESLVSLNPVTQEVEPRLAESWKVIDDGLIYEFKMREGVKFHDHHPLAPVDVISTFEKKHIQNAFYLSAETSDIFLDSLCKMVPQKDAPIVIYDQDGIGAANLVRVAQKNGYLNMVNLEGGYSAFTILDGH